MRWYIMVLCSIGELNALQTGVNEQLLGVLSVGDYAELGGVEK